MVCFTRQFLKQWVWLIVDLCNLSVKSAGEPISAAIIAMKMRVVMAGWSRGGRPLNEQTDFACFSVFFFPPTPASSSALGCSHETFFFVKFKLVSREVVHFVPFNDVWFAFPFISSAIPPKEQPNFFFFNHCAFFPRLGGSLSFFHCFGAIKHEHVIYFISILCNPPRKKLSLAICSLRYSVLEPSRYQQIDVTWFRIVINHARASNILLFRAHKAEKMFFFYRQRRLAGCVRPTFV